MKLPEGFELNVVFYTKNDAGLTAKLELGGKTDDDVAPSLERMDAEIEFLAGLSESYGGKWRPMTRAEIVEYKADQDAEPRP